MQLNELLEEFVLELQVRNISKRTIQSYKNNSIKFFSFLENKYQIIKLEEVKPKHIKDYATFMLGKGNKPSYINNIFKCLRAFYKYCLEEEYIKNNPMLKVKWQKEEKTVIETFTDEEVARMLKVFNDKRDFITIRNKTIMYCLIDLGLRAKELCDLDSLSIYDNTLKVVGKGKKERYLPISPLLKKQMLKYERAKASYYQDYMLKHTNYFLSFRAKPLTVEAVERVVKLCGNESDVRTSIRCSPHTIRHYYAQNHLRNGLDIYTLSRLLGHESVDITKRYLQSITDKQIVDMGISTSPLMNLR